VVAIGYVLCGDRAVQARYDPVSVDTRGRCGPVHRSSSPDTCAAQAAVKPNTVILHSRADEVVPFSDSVELVKNRRLPSSALIEVGTDHRLADEESLKRMVAVVAKRLGWAIDDASVGELAKRSLAFLASVFGYLMRPNVARQPNRLM
jgi:hypothetical protein